MLDLPMIKLKMAESFDCLSVILTLRRRPTKRTPKSSMYAAPATKSGRSYAYGRLEKRSRSVTNVTWWEFAGGGRAVCQQRGLINIVMAAERMTIISGCARRET